MISFITRLIESLRTDAKQESLGITDADRAAAAQVMLLEVQP